VRPHPSLLLLDLDNTLADRETAFRTWAAERAATWAPNDNGAADFLMELDADGLCPKPAFAEAVILRFGLRETADAVVADVRQGLLNGLPPIDPHVIHELGRLRAAGWKTALVTNGLQAVQTAKVQHLGAAHLFDAVCISGQLGVRKPDAKIFEIAAEACGVSLTAAWMIGDGLADIQGAHNARIRSIWLSRGRSWKHGDFAPDHVAGSLGEALSLLAEDPDWPTHPSSAPQGA
jgi:putative hydrolase of the HAD superfamily